MKAKTRTIQDEILRKLGLDIKVLITEKLYKNYIKSKSLKEEEKRIRLLIEFFIVNIKNKYVKEYYFEVILDKKWIWVKSIFKEGNKVILALSDER